MNMLENIKKLYEHSQSGIAVTDADFMLLWKNSDSLPVNVLLSDFQTDDDSVLKLPINHEITLKHRCGSAVKITPVYYDESIEGYMLTFYSLPDIELLSCRSGLVKFQNNFLGNIRIELAEIIGMLDRYKSKYSDNKEFDEADRKMRYHILRTFAATANLNELSKYYSGGIPNEFLNLSERIEETLKWAVPYFEANGCCIKADIAPQQFIDINYGRFEAALLNLMINAYMYNDAADKEIEIRLFTEDSSVILTISDNGTSADIEKIRRCSEFGSELSSYSNHEALGTVIARKMAEHNGGTLTFENSQTGGLYAKLALPKDAGKYPKHFRLRRMPPIISQYDVQPCILSKGLDPIF